MTRNLIVVALATALSLGCAACKSEQKEEEGSSSSSGEAEVDASGAEKPEENEATSLDLAPANRPPELEMPAWTRVGVGQSIGFGLEIIDPESDNFTAELVEMPESATYEPYTLTVEWTPTEADKPAALFVAKITETMRESGEKRTFLHRFSIDVVDDPQPKPIARTLGPPVEQLLTIHDPARLADANERWPLSKILTRSAELVAAEHGDEKAKIPDSSELYRQVLKAHARAHANPMLDPDDDSFAEDKYGSPENWTLIGVRARLDKKWQEVRMIYQADTPEAAYIMARFRPVSAKAKTEEQREFNNQAFSKIVLEHFFDEKGELRQDHWNDEAAHATAVADFLDAVIDHTSDEHDWANGGFPALPCGARLGGGSIRDDGKYAAGDGWAWHVIRPVVADGELSMQNVPIKGFVSGLEPNDDETAYEMRCASRYDASQDPHDPRFTGLCRKSGHNDLPAVGEGYEDAEGAGEDAEIVSAKIDAANLFVEHKQKWMVEDVPLDDPRRDLFEEKGMSCHQCHVRTFGVRDMYDPTAYDPKAGPPKRRNKPQGTTFFVIVPTRRWQPYTVDFQRKQECKARRAIAEFAEVETSLECPLGADLE